MSFNLYIGIYVFLSYMFIVLDVSQSFFQLVSHFFVFFSLFGWGNWLLSLGGK